MKLWKRLILIPGVFVGTLAAFWTVIEVMNFFEHPLAQTIRTWNHGAGLWILLVLSALLALLSPQILSESIVSAKTLKPLASAIKWLIRQWRYILLAVLLVFLELTLYWLSGLKLVALSVVHLALVILAIKLFAPKWPMVASSLDATSGLVERIDFDYLPEPPTSERGGWVLFTEGEPPKFSTAKYLGEKALEVQKVDNYYLDRDVRTDPERCGRVVEYVTRLKSGGVVYAHIYVQSLDRSKSEKSWIQFKVGTSRPPKKVGGNEWVLYVTPKDELKEGWQLFRENLIDATKQTFWKEGKSFERLIGFRLRGNLDLAYISVFES